MSSQKQSVAVGYDLALSNEILGNYNGTVQDIVMGDRLERSRDANDLHAMGLTGEAAVKVIAMITAHHTANPIRIMLGGEEAIKEEVGRTLAFWTITLKAALGSDDAPVSLETIRRHLFDSNRDPSALTLACDAIAPDIEGNLHYLGQFVEDVLYPAADEGKQVCILPSFQMGRPATIDEGIVPFESTEPEDEDEDEDFDFMNDAELFGRF